jgi:hypothetical protein
LEDSPPKKKKSRTSSKPASVDESVYSMSSVASDSDSNVSVRLDDPVGTFIEIIAPPLEKPSQVKVDKVTHRKSKPFIQKRPLLANQIGFGEESPKDDIELCGLCGTRHGLNSCMMTLIPENLVEYRHMLLTNPDYESLEERVRLRFYFLVDDHNFLLRKQPSELLMMP